jgi:hypothetical protein
MAASILLLNAARKKPRDVSKCMREPTVARLQRQSFLNTRKSLRESNMLRKYMRVLRRVASPVRWAIAAAFQHLGKIHPDTLGRAACDSFCFGAGACVMYQRLLHAPLTNEGHAVAAEVTSMHITYARTCHRRTFSRPLALISPSFPANNSLRARAHTSLSAAVSAPMPAWSSPMRSASCLARSNSSSSCVSVMPATSSAIMRRLRRTMMCECARSGYVTTRSRGGKDGTRHALKRNSYCALQSGLRSWERYASLCVMLATHSLARVLAGCEFNHVESISRVVLAGSRSWKQMSS